MTERASQLHTTIDRQIEDLIALLARVDEATLRLPCPGREKLGDGTVGAMAAHTADNYQRIVGFINTSDRMTAGHASTQQRAHRMPRFLRALGHGRALHADHSPGTGQHDDGYSADKLEPSAVAAKLSALADDVSQIAALTDRQLDAIPPKDSFRFCDGQRTLEQVITSLLKHQSHQIDALKAATSPAPGAT
jgi:hypothetical protein